MQDTEMQNSLKMKLASEVSRSGQNFPLPMFSRYHSIPFSLRKHSTQNISWDLFITIWGDLQNNPRREVYSHMWAIQVCVAQQDMLFASPTLEQGIKLNLHLWKKSIFYFIFTDQNRVKFLPCESPIIPDQATCSIAQRTNNFSTTMLCAFLFLLID